MRNKRISYIKQDRDFYSRHEGDWSEPWVYRRVTKDHASGARIVTSEAPVAPYDQFREDFPDVPVVGELATGTEAVDNPERFAVHSGALASKLQSIESIDRILLMRRRDGRSTAAPVYEERLQELLEAALEEEEPEAVEV